MENLKEIYNHISTPFYMVIGACVYKILEKFLYKKREIKDLQNKDIENEKCIFDNLERINNLLSKQLEINVQRYLDIMNNNISLKGENVLLREKVELMEIEVKKLRKEIKEFELEVNKLKTYIKTNIK